MVKLTYVARKIEGPKAVQAVCKDLKKRIPPGSSARSSGRDPAIEIDLTGKKLTDDGFSQFVDDLMSCIIYRDEEHPEGAARVTELHLQGNKLTVQSLVKLAQVVALSTGDLRELDISCNEIETVSEEQKEIWQTFLESFKGCYLMKKLDLGHNPLGPSGMEIFARVYIQSEVDFLETEAEELMKIKSDSEKDELVEELGGLKFNSGKENALLSSGSHKKNGKAKSTRQNGREHLTGKLTKADLKRFSCTRGLRSIPYLILSNLSLTSGSAIHMASMIFLHRTPDQLLEFLPAGKTPVLPNTGDRCHGLIWFPNENLGKSEHRLLEMAEMLRQQASESESGEEYLGDNENSSSDTGSTENSTDTILRQQKKKLDFEYSRVRKRVRIETLKTEGVHSAQIWATAVQMMLISRAVLLEDRDRHAKARPEAETQQEDEASEEEGTEQVPVQAMVPEDDIFLAAQEITKQAQWNHYELSIPEIPFGPFHPGTQNFEAEFPILQPESIDIPVNYPHDIQDSPTQGAEIKDMQIDMPVQESNERTPPPSPPRSHTQRFKNARAPVLTIAKKRSWRYGLPLKIWRRIIADAVGANGILDKDQQTLIMRYASDWDALAYEIAIQGARDEEKMWKFLEMVNCFTYSPMSGYY